LAVVLVVEPNTVNAGLASLIQEEGLFDLEVESGFYRLHEVVSIKSVHDNESMRRRRITAVQEQGTLHLSLLPLGLVIVETVEGYVRSGVQNLQQITIFEKEKSL